MKTKKLFAPFVTLLLLAIQHDAEAQQNPGAGALCSKSIVGYWHSFDNQISTVIKLRDVPCYYNVVDIAFIESTAPDDPDMVFRLDTVKVEKENEFIDDIKILKKRGVKVVASIGGAAGAVSLPDANAKTKFINSLIALIDKYGFEGIDIDIETGITVGGDTDFKNPSTPIIINLISACQALKAKYGADFWITMAPEVAYVQGGIVTYGGIWGAYLPIIYGLRNELTYIHVQYYNCSGNQAPDGNTYSPATADFIVAMSDMLLSGFKLGGTGQMFPALRPDQVAFGLPATTGAGGGYMAPSEVVKALDYLTKGASFGGQYKLSNTFSGMRGIMTWSVNWDNKSPGNYAFGKAFSQYFCNATNLCDPASGIQEGDRNNSFKIFPDPASDKIFLEKQSAFESVNIYSSMGNLVMKIENFNNNEINIKELPSGLYHIRFVHKGEITQRSIVKL